ncbi:hypothetical protein NEOLEDRAFT_1132570 [Neolentinus lepideus HHB14362 ss-1]|uniref:Uncharacterized protein n=1 Tax=Neolentinus lepideus HHB14362 ss-1 TaxID=1314782 RepID=A0A165T2Q9_9AGAM|nr:hypothetical protein NEOLEDRAFT_1132570 [Neolentinus lepideus HHB14362 ss-1]
MGTGETTGVPSNTVPSPAYTTPVTIRATSPVMKTAGPGRPDSPSRKMGLATNAVDTCAVMHGVAFRCTVLASGQSPCLIPWVHRLPAPIFSNTDQVQLPGKCIM